MSLISISGAAFGYHLSSTASGKDGIISSSPFVEEKKSLLEDPQVSPGFENPTLKHGLENGSIHSPNHSNPSRSWEYKYPL
jgi:hypothetical protein